MRPGALFISRYAAITPPAACPLRRPCLAGAVERGEPCGVWGGEIFERGRIIAFKRPRGHPGRQARAS